VTGRPDFKELGEVLREPVWYSALYGYAAHRVHGAEDFTEEMKDARDHALLLALASVTTVLGEEPSPQLLRLDERLLGRLSKRAVPVKPPRPTTRGAVRRALALRRGRRDRERANAEAAGFRRFLEETVEPAALVLLAGTILAADREVELHAGSTALGERESILPELRVAAGKGEWPNPLVLAQSVARRTRLEWHAHYNLACFFAQVGKRQADNGLSGEHSFHDARGHLRRALDLLSRRERAAQAAWAAKDSSLAPALKGWDAEERRRVLGGGASVAPEPAAGRGGLGGIAAIGGYAEALREEGIRTPRALARLIDDDEARKDLAAALQVSAATVASWGFLAQVVEEVDGVGPGEVNLLEAAGVGSLVRLAMADPDELHRQLTEVNTARGILRAVPSAATLAGWADQARVVLGLD
jgi:hypothetical protein